MNGRKRFFYNMNTCIGCGACQVACKDCHNLLPGEFYRRANIREVKTSHGMMNVPFSLSCNHCENPACAAACPTGAMRQFADGTVIHDDAPCIGCGRCYWACPYGEVSFSKTRGVAQKCDTCMPRRIAGMDTACVAACPTGSLRFGDVPESDGSRLDLPFLPSPDATNPSTRIRKAEVTEDIGHE